MNVLETARNQMKRAEKERLERLHREQEAANEALAKLKRESDALDPIRKGFNELNAAGILLGGKPFPVLPEGRYHEVNYTQYQQGKIVSNKKLCLSSVENPVLGSGPGTQQISIQVSSGTWKYLCQDAHSILEKILEMVRADLSGGSP
jgi:hypothetical protein